MNLKIDVNLYKVITRIKTKSDPAIKKRVYEYMLKGRFVNWLTDKMGFTVTGTTLPLPFCVVIFYLINDKLPPEDLKLVRVHESCHAIQAQTDGIFKWWLKYI